MAVKLDNELGGRAVQVHVVQGKEPDHFLAIFGSKLVIYSGGRASSFEIQEGEKDEVLVETLLCSKCVAMLTPTQRQSINFKNASFE